MAERNCLGLVMASELEAAPLLARRDFRLLRAAPFPVYRGPGTRLVIAGIGKANAAAATAFLIARLGPARVVNAGAAGALAVGLALGDIFQVGSIVEPDRPLLRGAGWHAAAADPLPGLPVASLATLDHPVRTARERRRLAALAELVDMEAAAVVQTCRQFALPVQVVKYVSDTAAQPDIVGNILRLRAAFCQALAVILWG